MDKDGGMGETPPRYFTYLKYREFFGITWRDFLDTPKEVVDKDLEMLSIEADVKNRLSKANAVSR